MKKEVVSYPWMRRRLSLCVCLWMHIEGGTKREISLAGIARVRSQAGQAMRVVLMKMNGRPGGGRLGVFVGIRYQPFCCIKSSYLAPRDPVSSLCSPMQIRASKPFTPMISSLTCILVRHPPCMQMRMRDGILFCSNHLNAKPLDSGRIRPHESLLRLMISHITHRYDH